MQKKSLILHPHGNILSRKSLQNHIITAGEFGLMEMFDVTVIGAGPAGLCAALQAARAGAGTALIEKNGMSGGTMTFCGINYPGIFDAWGKQVITGIGWDLIRKTHEETGGKLPEQFLDPQSMTTHWQHQIRVDALIFAALADEALQEAGVNVKYHTMPASLKHDGTFWRVGLCGKDGLYEVGSKIVIDCSGDANAVKIAGYEVVQPETTQPGTLSIYCHNFDIDKLDFNRMEENFKRAVEKGELTPEDMGWSKSFNRSFFYGFGGNCNHITGINAADSDGKTRMEIEGRRSILRLYRFLKQQPGLEQIEFHIKSGECGVRETRMIVGEKTIGVSDYLAGRHYDDSVCNAFYQVDLHDTEQGLVVEKLKPGVVPTVPLGALIPKNSRGFLAAGRILSSDRLSNSALRVQATCMATGQAAGAAAALAARNGIEPRDVAMPELRALLEANGAIVP